MVTRKLGRKMLLFSFLFLFQCLLKAQTFLPVLSFENSWIEHYSEAFGGQGFSYLEEAQINIAKDTLIDGEQYFKVHKIGRQKFGDEPQLPWQNFEKEVAILKELEGKVYIRRDQDDLLYDFNAQVGDTIDHWWGISPGVTIVAVDTIELCMQMRRRLKASTFTIDEVFFIEGVGTSSGLVPRYYYFENGATLECFSDKNCTPCPLVINTSNLTQPQMKIYPNPVVNEMILDLPAYQIERVEIYHANGLRVDVLSNGSNIIPMGHLEKGVYFIKVFLDEYFTVNKVLKQ